MLRRAKKLLQQISTLPDFDTLHSWLLTELKKAPLKADDLELSIALLASHYINNPDDFQTEIEKLSEWCAQALSSTSGKKIVKGWTSFRIPERLDYENLVTLVPLKQDKLERAIAPDAHLRMRDGFVLTDPRMTPREVLAAAAP